MDISTITTFLFHRKMVDGKSVGRKVIDRMHGPTKVSWMERIVPMMVKGLFIIRPNNKHEFTMLHLSEIMEVQPLMICQNGRKRMRLKKSISFKRPLK